LRSRHVPPARPRRNPPRGAPRPSSTPTRLAGARRGLAALAGSVGFVGSGRPLRRGTRYVPPTRPRRNPPRGAHRPSSTPTRFASLTAGSRPLAECDVSEFLLGEGRIRVGLV